MSQSGQGTRGRRLRDTPGRSADGPQRVGLVLDGAGLRRIRGLARQAGLESNQEIFEAALNLWAWALQKRLSGREVGSSEDAEGSDFSPLQSEVLDRAASRNRL